MENTRKIEGREVKNDIVARALSAGASWNRLGSNEKAASI